LGLVRQRGAIINSHTTIPVKKTAVLRAVAQFEIIALLD